MSDNLNKERKRDALEPVHFLGENLDVAMEKAIVDIAGEEDAAVSSPINDLLKTTLKLRTRKRDKLKAIFNKNDVSQNEEAVFQNFHQVLHSLREAGAYIPTEVLFNNAENISQEAIEKYQQNIQVVLDKLKHYQNIFRNSHIKEKLDALITYYESAKTNAITPQDIRIALISDARRPKYLKKEFLPTYMATINENKASQTQLHKVGYTKNDKGEKLFYKFFSTKNAQPMDDDKTANTIRAKLGDANNCDIATGIEEARLALTRQLNPNKQANAHVQYAQLEFMSLEDDEPDCVIMQYSLGMGNLSLDELFELIAEKDQANFNFTNLADELLAAWIAVDTDGKRHNYRASVTYNKMTGQYDIYLHNIDADRTLSDETPISLLEPDKLTIQTNLNSILLLILLNYPNASNNFDSIKKYLQTKEGKKVFANWLITLKERERHYCEMYQNYPVQVYDFTHSKNSSILDVANLQTTFKEEVLAGVEKRISLVQEKIQDCESLSELIAIIDPVTLSSYEHNIAIRQENEKNYPNFVADNEYEASQYILALIKEQKANTEEFTVTENDIINIIKEKTDDCLDMLILEAKTKLEEENTENSAENVIKYLQNAYPELKINYEKLDKDSKQSFEDAVQHQYNNLTLDESQINYHTQLLTTFLKYHLDAIPSAWLAIQENDKDTFNKRVDEENLRLKRCSVICAERQREDVSQTEKAPIIITQDNDKQMPQNRKKSSKNDRCIALSADTQKKYEQVLKDEKIAPAVIAEMQFANKVKLIPHEQVKKLLEENESDIRTDFFHKNADFLSLDDVRNYWPNKASLAHVHLENCTQILDDLSRKISFDNYDKALIKKIAPYTEINDWKTFEKLFPEKETYLSQLYLYKFSNLLTQLNNKPKLTAYQKHVKDYLTYSQEQQTALDTLLNMYESARLQKEAAGGEDLFKHVIDTILPQISKIDFKHCYKLNTPDESQAISANSQYYNRIINMLCDLNYDDKPIVLQNFTALKKADFYKIMKSKSVANDLSKICLYGASTLINELKEAGNKHINLIKHLSQQQSLSHFINQHEILINNPMFINKTHLLKSMQGADVLTRNSFVMDDVMSYFHEKKIKVDEYPQNFLGILPYVSSPDARLLDSQSSKKLSTSIKDNFKVAFNEYFDNLTEEQVLVDLKRYVSNNRKDTHFSRLLALTKYQGLLTQVLNNEVSTRVRNQPLIRSISGSDAYFLLKTGKVSNANYDLILKKHGQKLISYLNAHPEKYVALLSHFHLFNDKTAYDKFIKLIDGLSQKREYRASTHDARVFIVAKDKTLKDNNKDNYIKNIHGKDIYRLLISEDISNENKELILKKSNHVKKLISYCDSHSARYLKLAQANQSLIGKDDKFSSLFLIHKDKKTHDARIFILDIKARNKSSKISSGLFLNTQTWIQHFSGKDLFHLMVSDNLSLSRFNAIWKTPKHRENLIKFCDNQPHCWLTLLAAGYESMLQDDSGYDADSENNDAQMKVQPIQPAQFDNLFRSALVNSDNAMVANQIKAFVTKHQRYFTSEKLNDLFSNTLLSVIKSYSKKSKAIVDILSGLDNRLQIMLEMNAGKANLLLKDIQLTKADEQYVDSLLDDVNANEEKINKLLKSGSENTKQVLKSRIWNKLNTLSVDAKPENYELIIALLSFCYSNNNQSIVRKFSTQHADCIKAILNTIKNSSGESKDKLEIKPEIKNYLSNIIRNKKNSHSSVSILGCFGQRKNKAKQPKPSSFPDSPKYRK